VDKAAVVWVALLVAPSDAVVGGEVSGGVVTQSELPLSETGGLILPERATTTGPILLE
jgi:hypothetical protein